MKSKDQILLEEAYNSIYDTKKLTASERQVRYARMEAEEELYNAWMDFFNLDFFHADTEEEFKLVQANRKLRCDKAYEKALPLLGQEWVDGTIRNARKDSGEDEE